MRGGVAGVRLAALTLALALALAPGGARAEGTVSMVETSLDAPDEQDWEDPAWPVSARLTEPTDRYSHGILGAIPPFSMLEVTARACGACRHGWEDTWVRLPEDLVFEDVAPRLWDVTGDGRPEIVVVEASLDKGARLAVWAYPDMVSAGDLTRLAATPFIGTPQRWLAPAGIADFGGDGRLEIAYVDRPHLVADLVYVRLEADRLVEVARLPGVTNHRIGDEFISGGLRDCGQGPELVAASADWSRLLVIGWEGGPVARNAGAWSAKAAADALACR